MVYPESVPGACRLRGSVRARGARGAAGFLVFVLLAGVASAQTYPGGMPPTYPGQRPYPGSGPMLPGIPLPTRGNKGATGGNTAAQPLPNFRGKAKQMDSKSVPLTLDDDREMEFKRTDKTKFFKNGDEVKSPSDFKPGDQISVEGPEDIAGNLTAVNVYWEKAASVAATSSGKNDGVPDTWAGDAEKTAASTVVSPPPAKPDADDPGPPQLRRGRPADPSRERAQAVPDQPPAQPPATVAAARIPPPAPPPSRPAAPPPQPSIMRNDEDLSFGAAQQDPLIRKAANAALDFTETLPNYVCQEMVARFQSEVSPANWQAMDIVSAEVVYEGGKEDYRNITVGGKPVKKSMEEIGGAWSTGEFGTILINLFNPGTAAQFHYRKDSRVAGINAKEYGFEVTHENSHWTVRYGSQSYVPGFSGSVWIDPATARVLRIEMEARSFPDQFETDHVESATDYQYVRLGGTQQYLLPVHSETLSCQRGASLCAKNTIDFRNYKKFEGQSTVTFGDVKP